MYPATQNAVAARLMAMSKATREARDYAVARWGRNGQPAYVVCPVVVAKRKRLVILETYR